MYYEKEFNGILPLEIYIDGGRKESVRRLSTIRNLEKVQNAISEFPELSTPISLVNGVKYSKQACFEYFTPLTKEIGVDNSGNSEIAF